MGAVIFVVTQTVNSSLVHGVDNALVDETHEFAGAAHGRPAGQTLAQFALTYLRTRAFPRGTVALIEITNHDILGTAGSLGVRTAQPVLGWLAAPPRRGRLAALRVGTTTFQGLATPITAGGRRLGTFVVAANLAPLHQQEMTTLMATIAQAVAALAIAMLAAYAVLRRVLRVVGRVSGTAEAIGREDLSRRLEPVAGGDELSHLVDTFNAMLARLDTTFQGQRQLLADVSHQLRTPLTVIRGHLEVLRRGGFADQVEVGDTVDLVLDELAHTTALVGDLLLLGRAREPDFLDRSPVPVRALLDDAFTAAQTLAPRHWRLEVTTDAVLLVDRTKLRGAILNLVENAVAATGPGDSITLAAREGRWLVISVADTGRGLSVEDQARVFDRFRRGPAADHRGAGLGLSIVRTVVVAHGGRVSMASRPGAGCTVSIELPNADSTPSPPSRERAGARADRRG